MIASEASLGQVEAIVAKSICGLEACDRVTDNDIWSSVSFFSVEAGDGGYDRVLSVGAGEGGASVGAGERGA